MLHFKLADEKWLDFICDNQSGKLTGEYDIVIGPVADDRVYLDYYHKYFGIDYYREGRPI